MKVNKINSMDCFNDENDGLTFGVEWDIGNEEFHCEWFGTEEEQERAYQNCLKEFENG